MANLSLTAWCGASIVSREEGQQALDDPAYMLLFQSCEDAGACGYIFIWGLDRHGRLMDVALAPDMESDTNADAIEAFVRSDTLRTDGPSQRTTPIIMIYGDLVCRSSG